MRLRTKCRRKFSRRFDKTNQKKYSEVSEIMLRGTRLVKQWNNLCFYVNMWFHILFSSWNAIPKSKPDLLQLRVVSVSQSYTNRRNLQFHVGKLRGFTKQKTPNCLPLQVACRMFVFINYLTVLGIEPGDFGVAAEPLSNYTPTAKSS